MALEKSDETPQVILKLSEMMRYTIYDCKESQVPIGNEISYLENYHERNWLQKNFRLQQQR